MSDESNGKTPGLFSMAASVIKAPFEERALRAEVARNERLSYEASNQMLQEVTRRVSPDDDEFTRIMLGSGGKELDESAAGDLRSQARLFARRQPHAIGYLRSLNRFVLGKGPTFRAPADLEQGVQDQINEWWQLFTRTNDWDHKEDEYARRRWRDGEAFVRRFDEPPEMEVSDAVEKRLGELGSSGGELRDEVPEWPDGMIFIRFVDPEHIRDPEAKISHGIITAKGDVETVLGYIVAPGDQPGDETEVVPASQMLHGKINVDSNEKRGRSQLEAILRRTKQYDKWLDSRIMLNFVRSAVTLIKRYTNATPAQVKAIRDGQATTRDDPTNSRSVQALKPGTTKHVGPGVEYEFLTPNLQAQDAEHDGRSILLNMAAATGIPEFMFTGDASNANYSSTLVADGPATREFDSQQDDLTPEYAVIWRWAIVAGAAAGEIEGLNEEDAEDLTPEIEWPSTEVRDELPRTQANEIRHRARILSGEGWAQGDGIDYERETERLEAERQRDFEFTAPPDPEPEP